MKKLEIEHTVQIFNHDTTMAYAIIVNIAIHCQTKEEIHKKIEETKLFFPIHLHFKWGFGRNHFWVNQRKERNSEELFEDRILIVTF